ncbi:MAG: tRNA uridine-5-carboxymethylaminomethyl(34) synthesis GTPase MnmE [Rhodospirillales bacterium]|nr:tRNA uridine-5-carboxymethylaminomethyl(34) synthesis GTPase MnmE [Rhodospirillales bacterium]MCB9997017.1 tRNA uridine-5-carboxymethylaminomethyl(34) synthesis GTPase MnmE [Rhodospirillales bacterium]
MTINDTIYALATPPGKGGVAVVRVSGVRAKNSLMAIAGRSLPSPRATRFCKIMNPVSRETIDRGLVIYFRSPASFTGEDVAEYHLHGGVAVVRALLDVLADQDGHRLAAPGEFTRRAFENGKIDLTEAEAVADLIDAETALQRSQALTQLEGGLSAIYNRWRDALKKALAYLEADLEFPDEDMPEGVAPEVVPILENLCSEMAAHLDDNRRGERLRDGIKIAVIGAPNAGKSSLVNVLARRDVAIVSEHAGTTRDVIEVHLDLGGYPVILSDTAGLRPEQLGQGAQDQIEGEGIRRAIRRAEEADIRILLFDASAAGTMDSHTLALKNDSALVVFNKVDKGVEKSAHNYEGESVHISAQSGEGLSALIDLLAARIDVLIGRQETPSLTRARHREALQDCRDALVRAFAAPLPELVAEDVRLAIRQLGRITGRVDVEDLLDVIFKDFCIGK